MTHVAIIVPVFNRLEYTKIFLDCLNRNTYKSWTLFIIDDGSTDGTDTLLEKVSIKINQDDQVPLKKRATYHIEGDGNWWWTKSINTALRVALRSGAELILTQNNDVEIPADYLECLVEAYRIKPGTIITTPIFNLSTGVCLPDGGGIRRDWILAKDIKLPRVARIENGSMKTANNNEVWRELTHSSGRGCLIPRAVFDKVGMYDDVNLPQYQADDDLTFRAAHNGFPVFMYLRTYCYTPAEETGLTAFVSERSWSTFIGYLTSQKSPANIKRRFWITVRHCRPRIYAPVSLMLDLIRVLASYWIQSGKSRK